MKRLTILAFAALALFAAIPAAAGDTTPANLSTEQRKIFLLPDGTWVEKVIVVDSTGADTQGTDATGVTPPTGATGVRGWLSGIYNAITGNVKVVGVSGGQPLPVAGCTVNTVLSATNPACVSLYSSTGTALVASANNASQSPSATANKLNVDAFTYVSGPTNWDQAKSVTNADASGTGVTAVGMIGTSFTNVTTATTTTIKSGNGTWLSLVVNSPAADTVTCYANTSASGTKIGTFAILASTQPFTIPTGNYFTTGLTCVTSGTADLTFNYR